jgi:hypothetical protein
MASVVLHTDSEPHTSETQCVVRLSWTAGRHERDGGSRITVPELAVFAGAKRAQFLALGEAAVTAGLREVVSGETCLASLRPQAALRLATTPIVLAARRGFSSGRGQRSPSVESRDGLDEVVDEGGIYSW